MAGYLITLNDEDALARLVKNGVYSTIMRSPANSSWGIHHEGTFADYLIDNCPFRGDTILY